MSKIRSSGLLFESLITTAVLIGLVRLLVTAPWDWVRSYQAVLFTIIALYLPMMVIWLRKRSLDFMESSAGEVFNGIVFFLVVSLLIFPPFLLLAHFWQTNIIGLVFAGDWKLMPPSEMIIGQVLMVALPEEFFFRGYLQTNLNKVFGNKWRLFGVRIGYGWLATAVIFAAAHSIIYYQWWHFAIFFPALLFGYLRERSGGLVAPILFHALSNLVMWWLNVHYG